MAADHRRVEPRSIVGTGMATDAERITQITDDAARRERAWRNAPERAFGEVLGQTPARAGDDDDGHDGHERDDGRPAPHDGRGATGDGSGDDAGATPPAPTASASSSSTSPPASPRAPLRAALRAPDPRARLLHARLPAKPGQTSPGRGTATTTTPTKPTATTTPEQERRRPPRPGSHE